MEQFNLKIYLNALPIYIMAINLQLLLSKNCDIFIIYTITYIIGFCIIPMQIMDISIIKNLYETRITKLKILKKKFIQ